MSCIKITHLTKGWGDVIGVDRVSVTIPQGALTVLLGPSGCGKSTILRLIAGLETATSGSICIGGREVSGLDPAARGVSMVFQSYALFPHLSVRENILFGLKVRKVEKSEQAERLDAAAAMVGLSDLLDRRPAQLSGGQRQRVALARSIVSRRKICLMDEPLSNLDAKLRAEMREEICALQRRLGLTMVYVTHDQVEAMTMADQVVLLNRGRIVQAGPPKDLYDWPEHLFSATFMGAPPMNLFAFDRKTAAPALADSWSGQAPHTGTLGIRPEHLRASDSGLEARVLGVEYLGSETIIKLQYAGTTICMKTAMPPVCRPGDSLFLSWNRNQTHCFDTQGRRIPARTPTSSDTINPRGEKR